MIDERFRKMAFSIDAKSDTNVDLRENISAALQSVADEKSNAVEVERTMYDISLKIIREKDKEISRLKELVRMQTGTIDLWKIEDDKNRKEIEIHKKESERLAWELEELRIKTDDVIDGQQFIIDERQKAIERLKAEIEKYCLAFSVPSLPPLTYGVGMVPELNKEQPAPSFCLECNQPFVGTLATICDRCVGGLKLNVGTTGAYEKPLTGDAVKHDNIDPA